MGKGTDTVASRKPQMEISKTCHLEVTLCRAGKNEGDRVTRVRVCPWTGDSCTSVKKALALHNNSETKQHSLDLAIPLWGIYLIYTWAKDDHYSIFKNIKLENNALVNSLLPK